jgi:hypothetical protein
LYTPSLHEISVVTAGILIAIVLYLGGEKVLNAHKFQKHAIVPPGAFICQGCGGIHYMKEGESQDDALKRHHRMRKVDREDEHA